MEAGHEQHVLPASEQVVDGGELAGDADGIANGLRFPPDVETGHLGPAGIGSEDGRQDLYCRGLACAIGTEEREDRTWRNLEVDAVEHDLVAKRLTQPCHLQR